jgi:hypothetical protein
MMHYAKGVAHSALGDVPAAAAEQALFRGAVKRVPKSRYLHNVPCVQLLAVAEEMLEGELSYRRGEHDAAFARLRAAVAMEDDLPYDEPWGGMQPIRHALGALLLEQDRTVIGPKMPNDEHVALLRRGAACLSCGSNSCRRCFGRESRLDAALHRLAGTPFRRRIADNSSSPSSPSCARHIRTGSLWASDCFR